MDTDLDSICRLCLNKSDNMIGIFENNENNFQMKILASTSIELKNNDNLPKLFCCDCRYQLEKSYIFRIKCKNADNKLKRHMKLVNAGKISVLDEDDEVFDEIDDYSLNFIKEYETMIKNKHGIESKETIDELIEEKYEETDVEEKLQEEVKYEAPGVVQDIELDPNQEEYVEVYEDYQETEDNIFDQNVADREEMIIIQTSNDDANDENVQGIKEAIKQELAQHPGLDIKGKVTIKLDKVSKDLTKVRIESEEGNIFLMEFAAAASSSENDVKNEKEIIEKDISENVQKGVVCDQCNKWCPTKSSLDRHYRIHTGERPFKCEECGRDFIQKEVLRRHLYIHTDTRPFECGECDKKFIQKELLRQHVERVHRKNATAIMHQCSLCPKSFCHLSGLSRHMAVHQGKRFNCGVCNRQFMDKSALRRHERGVHSSKNGNVNDHMVI